MEVEVMYKQSWRNESFCPAICLETVRRTRSNLIQESHFAGRGVKPGPPEYTAGVLPDHDVQTYSYALCSFQI